MHTEVLILAMTHMRSGLCTAGLTMEPHPLSRLKWVRPVKPSNTLLLGDVTTPDGHVIGNCDVVDLDLGPARCDPPHVEDCICDMTVRRPRLLRQLTGAKRARFFETHLDRAPGDVLRERPSRSLCLVEPKQMWACFSLDTYSGKYEARIGFRLAGQPDHRRAAREQGVPATDLAWRAWGRAALVARGGGRLVLTQEALFDALGVERVYLALGLSRPYRGHPWLMVIGVHTVPGYASSIDYDNL